MSLQTPTAKMSKSDTDPRSRILLTDSPAEIRKKVMSALTDSTNAVSYDPVGRPGVANLLGLLALFEGSSAEVLAQEMASQGAKLKDLKGRVADAVVAAMDGVGERFREILGRDGGRYLNDVAEEGARKARGNADETMRIVRDAVGL
jgi:tryptophanyl-tRNA synthetase